MRVRELTEVFRQDRVVDAVFADVRQARVELVHQVLMVGGEHGEAVFRALICGALHQPQRQAAGADLNRSTPAYEALLESGKALIGVILRNKGGANKDLKKFTAEIEKLVRKWDRE